MRISGCKRNEITGERIKVKRKNLI